ncbi:MAG: DUF1636 domain-containing protein [Pseudomonadota bacterium]
MTSWITICDTCKREGWLAGDTDGEKLAALVEAAAEGAADVRTRRMSCTMGCSRACNVTLQAEGKLAYTLGEFEPTQDAAEALVEYATKHAASDTGQVPYREWPQGVKGHFVTRMAPIPSE